MTSVAEQVSVADVLRLAGRPSPNERGFFLCPAHSDQNPSAHVAASRRGWKCFSCGERGGVLDLAVHLGAAPHRAGAAKWLETQLGRPADTYQPRVRPGTADEIANAIASELERILIDESTALGCSVAVLSRHVAAARSRVAKREGLRLKSPPTVWWESAEPHASDRAFKFFVDRSIEERAWTTGVPPGALRAACERDITMADAVLCDAARMLREATW
jgi:CHC2 zinc finger